MTEIEVIERFTNLHGWFDISGFHKYLKEKSVKIYRGEYHEHGDGNTHYLYYINLGDNKIAINEFQANDWDSRTYIETVKWFMKVGIEFIITDNNEQN